MSQLTSTEINIYFIQTDDKGVFMTTLSDEYYIAAKTFGLNKEDLWQISSKAMEYTFDQYIKLFY